MSESKANMVVGPEQALILGESLVGGKAWGLARLHQANAQVPQWCVVPASGCLNAYKLSGLKTSLEHHLEKLKQLDTHDEIGRAPVWQRV